MPRAQPTVLEGLTVKDFLRHLLNLEELVTLIVCGSRDAFVTHLRLELGQTPEESPLVPTLRTLVAAQRLKLVFCTDLSQFRAYAAIHGLRDKLSTIERDNVKETTGTLAVLNSVGLHRSTSSLSVQGLSRSLAVVVETAHRMQENLILVECPFLSEDSGMDEEVASNGPTGPTMISHSNSSKIWDESVSILNVSTKTFGMGERGWAGRTVQIRTIAERWFCFANS